MPSNIGIRSGLQERLKRAFSKEFKNSSSSPQPQPDDDLESKYGLFTFTPRSTNDSVETKPLTGDKFDLVAVHGLNGDPRRTWTSKENDARWLLDFLPWQFPGARVMSFGYNSAVAFSGSKMTIRDFARDLLNRLAAARREDNSQQRPLIFVCHSLGGIVVKKTLVLAHEEDGQYGDILSVCAGIVFMGTPHRGSSAASWAKMLASIINTVSISNVIRRDLLKTLKTTSKELHEISSQSVHRLSKLPIASVVECRPVIPLGENLVVERHSAVLGLPNEVIIPSDADHRTIATFNTIDCPRYASVTDCIWKMVQVAQHQSAHLSILPPQLASAQASSGTGAMAYSSFQEWLSSFAGKYESKEDTDAITANIRSVKAKSGDKSETTGFRIPERPPVPSISPQAQGAAPLKTTDSTPVRIIVKGLQKADGDAPVTEEITANTSDEVYHLLRILHERGYKNICGFKGAESGVRNVHCGPVNCKTEPLNVEVTTGPSSYSISNGLRINADQPLIDFLDDFLSSGPGGIISQGGIRIETGIDSLALCDTRSVLQTESYSIRFHRTMRVPDDGKTYHLPVRKDKIQLLPVSAFAARLPTSLTAKGGVMIPLYQREALLLSFGYCSVSPDPFSWLAIRVFAGSINCLSGESASEQGRSSARPQQDYMILPPQNRLDGFYSGDGVCKQFVAMPIGSKYTAEWQLSGKEFIGGLQIQVAPRYPHGCSFQKAKSGRKLDHLKSPKQLGMENGQQFLVQLSDEYWEKIKLPRLTRQTKDLFRDVQLYPISEGTYRPTYISGLLRQFGGSKSSMERVSCTVNVVYPFSIKLDWNSIVVEPKRPTAEKFSPFLEYNDFVNLVTALVEKAGPKVSRNYLQVNRKVLVPNETFVQITQYSWDSGVISLSTKEIKIDFPIQLFGSSRRGWHVSGWDMGLTAGGRVKVNLEEDEDPSVWNWKKAKLFNIQILNSVAFEDVTGITPPPSSIQIRDFVEAKIPITAFGNYPIQEALKHNSAAFNRLKTVMDIDHHRGISTGITINGDNLICCLICERNLCDSILQPCNHIFCTACIDRHIRTASGTQCAGCLATVTNIVRFSSPMEVVRVVSESAALENERSVEEVPDLPPKNPSNDKFQLPMHEGQRTGTGSKERGPILSFAEATRYAFQGVSDIATAAADGDIPTIRRLLQDGADINSPASKKGGRTALQAAAEKDHLDMVRLLINSGAEPNAPRAKVKGVTALQAAASNGNVKMAQLLIDSGADVQGPSAQGAKTGRTPLQAATAGGHVPVVRLLLQNGANPSAFDAGDAPLQIAAKAGSLSIVTELLASGADADDRNSLEVKKSILRGVTPLHRAAMNGTTTVVACLVQHGADLFAYDKTLRTPLHVAVGLESAECFKTMLASRQFEAFQRMKRKHKCLLFKAACDRGDYSRVEILLKLAASKKEKEEFHCWALYFFSGRGDANSVSRLLKLGVSPTMKICWDGLVAAGQRDHREFHNTIMKFPANTSLLYATQGGHLDVIKLLLSHGARTGVCQTTTGKTSSPLGVAVRSGNIEMFDYFVRQGCKVDLEDKEQILYTANRMKDPKGRVRVIRTMFSYKPIPVFAESWKFRRATFDAIQDNNVEAIRALVDNGAKITESLNGREPLAHASIKWGSDPIPTLELLSAHGIHLDRIDTHCGYTIWYDVAKDNKLPVAEYLLRKGVAHLDREFTYYPPPVFMAIEHGHVEMARLLLRSGADPNQINKHSGTLFHHAIAMSPNEAIAGILALIHEFCTLPIDTLDDHHGRKQRSALQLAVLMNRSEAVKLLLSYGADPKNVMDSEETNNGFIDAETLNEVFYESNAMFLIREALGLPLETKMPEGCRIRRRVEWINERSWTARDENGDEEKHLAGHCRSWNCAAGQDDDEQDDDDTDMSDCPIVKYYKGLGLESSAA